MKSSIEWHDDAQNAAPEERATVADVRLWLEGRNVTQHLNEGVLEDHVTVALYSLANGIAHDWWTIFGARDREISLLKYRDGYLLPDLRVRFDGAAFEVAAEQKFYDRPEVSFWGAPTKVMSRRDGETFLSELVEQVLTRLEQQGVKETSAALRWRRVEHSRHSNEASFCEAVGSLGLDPYEIDDATANAIEEAEALFGGESLVEFVSGAGGVDLDALIRWVGKMANFHGFRYRLADVAAIAKTIARSTPPIADEPPWSTGYRRARKARRQLNISQSDRFASYRALAEKVGAQKSFGLAPSVDGIKALRRDHANGVHVHVRNHGDSPEAKASHLFTLARGIGDAVCFPDSGLAPVNGLRNARRQAAGRAFAAEFLAPIDEIRTMVADQKDIVTIADEFAVSTEVIARQLENAPRIDAACALDAA